MFSSYIPLNLNETSSLFLATVFLYGIVLFRYFLIVGIFYLVFYIWQPLWAGRRQIYSELPSRQEQVFEIKWSVFASLIFAIAGAGMGWLWQNGWTQIYLKFDQYGWFYFLIGGPFLVAVLHDTYFYWTHRLLHHPWFYRRYHAVHHASLRPSPWASFSFHPGESVINALALPLIVMIVPIHPVMLLVHLTLMTLTAVTNHLGFEVLPGRGTEKWLISGIHHSQHHRYFRYNYGLFFTWWDVLMKTEHKSYQEDFNKILQKS